MLSAAGPEINQMRPGHPKKKKAGIVPAFLIGRDRKPRLSLSSTYFLRRFFPRRATFRS